MRMMRVPECLEALDGRLTKGQLSYGIRKGYYKSARVGGVLVVDFDTVCAQLEKYQPRRAYPNGLVTKEELMRQTGLSRHQVEQGVRDGWIRVSHNGSKRGLYDLQAVTTYLAARLSGEGGGRK